MGEPIKVETVGDLLDVLDGVDRSLELRISEVACTEKLEYYEVGVDDDGVWIAIPFCG